MSLVSLKKSALCVLKAVYSQDSRKNNVGYHGRNLEVNPDCKLGRRKAGCGSLTCTSRDLIGHYWATCHLLVKQNIQVPLFNQTPAVRRSKLCFARVDGLSGRQVPSPTGSSQKGTAEWRYLVYQ